MSQKTNKKTVGHRNSVSTSFATLGQRTHNFRAVSPCTSLVPSVTGRSGRRGNGCWTESLGHFSCLVKRGPGSRGDLCKSTRPRVEKTRISFVMKCLPSLNVGSGPTETFVSVLPRHPRVTTQGPSRRVSFSSVAWTQNCHLEVTAKLPPSVPDPSISFQTKDTIKFFVPGMSPELDYYYCVTASRNHLFTTRKNSS